MFWCRLKPASSFLYMYSCKISSKPAHLSNLYLNVKSAIIEKYRIFTANLIPKDENNIDNLNFTKTN